MPTSKLKPLAQHLRKSATREENKLWYQFLRTYPFQFNRQHVFGTYIVDFYCYKAKLAIELDGSQHFFPVDEQKDVRRTEFLKKYGIEVLRILNSDIWNYFPDVCAAIEEEVNSRIANKYPHPPA